MRLTSVGGNYVELSVRDYQFPDTDTTGDDDANWLMIRGRVGQESRSWAFEQPCLLTDEAARIEDWLRGVVSGSTSVTPADVALEYPQSSSALGFLEPELAFSLVERGSAEATIRVYFSLSARPPWDDRQFDIYAYFVPLRLPLSAVGAAADRWARDIAAFPPR